MFSKKLSLGLCSLALVLLAGCGSTSGHYVPSSSPEAPPVASDALSMPPEPTPNPTPAPPTPATNYNNPASFASDTFPQ